MYLYNLPVHVSLFEKECQMNITVVLKDIFKDVLNCRYAKKGFQKR